MEHKFSEDDVRNLILKCRIGEVDMDQIFKDETYCEMYVWNSEKIKEAIWLYENDHKAYLGRKRAAVLAEREKEAAKPAPKIERYLTPKQIGRLFHKDGQSIQRLCRIGKIQHFERVGDYYLIDVYSQWPNLFAPEIEEEEKEKETA